MNRRALLYGGLFAGVIAVSFAALLIRLAAAPALSIAAYRLVIAGVPTALLAGWRSRAELRRLSPAEAGIGTLSGVCLAGHFATWVASLQYATVASSVTLVTTSPFFVAAFAFLFLRERISCLMLCAIVICTAGGIVIGATDFASGTRSLVGDGLALAGAVFAAAYLTLGRRMRMRVSLLAYVGIVYPVAAVSLLLMAVASRQPLAGFSGHTYLMLTLLALVPQLIGHSALNWALGYLSASFVAVAVLGEPVLATLLAAMFLSERPGWDRILGGALILAGVYLALHEESVRTGCTITQAGLG